jgi:hypothetical protein
MTPSRSRRRRSERRPGDLSARYRRAAVSARRAASAETATGRAVRRARANLADHLECLSLTLLKTLIRQRGRQHADLSKRRVHLALQLRRRPARRRPTHGPFSAVVEWSTRLPGTVERAALPRSALLWIHFFVPRSAACARRSFELVFGNQEAKGLSDIKIGSEPADRLS